MENSIIVVGGYGGSDGGYEAPVAQFKEDSWTKLGDLNQPRRGHNCLRFDSEILVVGGLGEL